MHLGTEGGWPVDLRLMQRKCRGGHRPWKQRQRKCLLLSVSPAEIPLLIVLWKFHFTSQFHLVRQFHLPRQTSQLSTALFT